MCYAAGGLFVLFEGADGNAVPGFFFEHIANAFAFSNDAVSVDFVLAHESFLNAFSAGLSELNVEVVVTVLGSITLDDNLGFGMALHVVGDHGYVGHLIGSDYAGTDAEEYEAYGVVLVGNFLNHLYFGLAVLASFEFGSEFAGLSLPCTCSSEASLELTAEVVDLTVESVDFSLVVGLNALEAITEVIGNAGHEVEGSVVLVVSAGGLVPFVLVVEVVTVGHIPSDAGLEGDGNVLADIEVEVKTNLCCEVVPVFALAFLVVAIDIIVSPACAAYYFETEYAALAVVTTEESYEVNSAVHTYIGVVESGCGVNVAAPVGSVNCESGFNAEGESGSYLLLDVETCNTAHISEEGCVMHGGRNTTVETDRPIVKETGLLNSLSGSGESTKCYYSRKNYFLHKYKLILVSNVVQRYELFLN